MNDQPSAKSAPNILVIDDVPENLKLIVGILKHRGYKVRPVSSGVLALDAARMMSPDLILLDINMPGMNGYEVCEQFRADEALADIPIIFLSALNDMEDKVRGLRGGGNDYITKPFQAEEVLARIDMHLELRRLRLGLKNQNDVLEEKVRVRTLELTLANERLAIIDKAKSDFLTLISHELRTPLNGIFGIADLIFDQCQFVPEVTELVQHYDHSRQRILSIVDDALLLTQIGIQSGLFSVGPVLLTDTLQSAIGNAGNSNNVHPVVFDQLPQFPAPVLADRTMLLKALEALLEIAGKFSTGGSMVKFTGTTFGDCVVLEFRAAGYSIPQDCLPKIFDVLAVAETLVPGGDLGLKFPLAQRIVSLMGGSVTAENTDSPGICLKVRLQRSAESNKRPKEEQQS